MAKRLLPGMVLGRSAQPVEKGKKDYCQGRAHQRIEQELEREKWRRMIQQNTLGDGQQNLVKVKK
jgi:hypothetical protein